MRAKRKPDARASVLLAAGVIQVSRRTVVRVPPVAAPSARG
jgi:hypothetical protein